MGKVISLFGPQRPVRAPTRDELRAAAVRDVREASARLEDLATRLAQFDLAGRPKRRSVRAIHACRDPEVRALVELAERCEVVASELAGELDDIPF